MANDRLWLRCKVCHGAFLLAKHIATGWYYNGNHDYYGERFEKFLDDHDECFFKDPFTFEILYEDLFKNQQYDYDEKNDRMKIIEEKAFKTHDVNTFSNGTEYYQFMEKNCLRCRHYVDWEEVYGEKPACETEEALAKAYWDKKWFPKGKIKMNYDLKDGRFYTPHCIDFKEEVKE